MNNIFNQILEEVLLEEETEAVRNINKRKLAKWAYVEGIAKLQGTGQPFGGLYLVIKEISVGAKRVWRSGEEEKINKNLRTGEDGKFSTIEAMPAGNYSIELASKDGNVFVTSTEGDIATEYKLPETVFFTIPAAGSGQTAVKVELLLTKMQEVRHFEDDAARFAAALANKLKTGDVITIGPDREKFKVLSDDGIALRPLNAPPSPVSEPTEIESNFYEVTAAQIIVFANADNEKKLKEIYLSIFNNQQDLFGGPNNIKKLALLRVLLSLDGPTTIVGESQSGFKLLAIASKNLENSLKVELDFYNTFELEGKYNFEESYNLDQYGILLPDMDEVAKRKSSLNPERARELQYKYNKLFDIIKNVNLKIDAYDEEEAETEETENPPLDRRTNDPRIKDGRSAITLPKLQIFPKQPRLSRGVLFYGEKDPLHLRKKKKYDLNDFTRKYFGKTFEEYKFAAHDDVTRDTVVRKKNGDIQRHNRNGLAKGDLLISTANYYPFHVAMAYEELYSGRTEKNNQNIKEYDAILYFETAADKRKSKSDFKRINSVYNNKVRSWPKNLNYVPDSNQVAPGRIKKILEKRLAYFGAGSGVGEQFDPIERTSKKVKWAPEYGGKKFKDITGVVGASTLRPLNIISDEAKEMIILASGKKSGHSNLRLRVRSPGGQPLFSHHVGQLFIISENSKYPDAWDKLPNVEGNDRPPKVSTAALEIEYDPASLPSMGQPVTGTIWDGEKDIIVKYGSIFFIPKNIVGNNDVNEDNVDPFTEAEKIFAKRLGVRLDQDFRVDLVTGQSNFTDLNKYNTDGSVTGWKDDDESE
jgi:hypothetical protein